MNEKTRVQIEEMKKQTLGVEVEMNNIERSRAAKVNPCRNINPRPGA